METIVYTFSSVFLISSVSLIGIIFFHKSSAVKKEEDTTEKIIVEKETLEKILPFLVSFAVGGLFGDSFIHLLPEAFEELGANLGTSLKIVAGLLCFFSLEKFIRWKHCR